VFHETAITATLEVLQAGWRHTQWFIRALHNNHRLESGARLKANDARNFPKPVTVPLRKKAKAVRSPD
jgi:hypothetical protein